MSRFEQNRQNVNTQINIAGSDNPYCTLWITSKDKESIFSVLVQKAPKTGLKLLDGIGSIFEVAQLFGLTSDPDFKVFIDGEFSDTLGVGETKKFDITPGKHTVEIELNITEYRKNMGANWIDAAQTLFNRGTNKITFPINPGETVELICENSSIRFNR